MLRIPRCIDNWLINGGETVSLTHRPRSTLQKHFYFPCLILISKRPLGRPTSRWIDNIKMDLLEIGVNVVDWIGLAQDRYRWRTLVNSVMNLRVP
jgi:hypothetical protein